MRNLQAAALTETENQITVAEFAFSHRVSIKVLYSSKIKQRDENKKEIATELKVENVLYH